MAACSAPPRPDGAQTYAIRCGYCHDVDGGIGTRLTDDAILRYGTVGSLRRYLTLAMPYDQPGTLSAEENMAVTDYLVTTRGLVPLRRARGPLPDTLTLGKR